MSKTASKRGTAQRRTTDDLISRESLLVSFSYDDDGTDWSMKDILHRIEEFPTASPKEAKTAQWEVYEVANTEEEKPIAWRCTNCGEVVGAQHDYCPGCGGKMVSRTTERTERTKEESLSFIEGYHCGARTALEGGARAAQLALDRIVEIHYRQFEGRSK